MAAPRNKKSKLNSVHQRSICPIACALDIFGDRWTLLVIRDLVCGKTQFKEFLASPEGIATNILADRLDRLCRHEVAEKYSLPGTVGREAYRLTNKGQSLRPIIRAITDWGITNIPGTEARMAAKR